MPAPMLWQSASAPQPAQLWLVRSQIGVSPWQSVFVRQPTHIPCIAPASAALVTQTFLPPSSPWQPALSLQAWQAPVSRSQIGLVPMHDVQENGAPPMPPLPVEPPAPPFWAVHLLSEPQMGVGSWQSLLETQ